MIKQTIESHKKRDWPLIIAEIGANYGGIETVKASVRSAFESGADIVKFQTYQAETIAKPGTFFIFDNGSKMSQYDFFKSHELNKKSHDDLDALCKEIGIQWTSTPSHVSDLDLLENYNLPFYKTGSDDITNLPFLKEIANKGRPMVISTGMCSIGEIELAVEAVQSTGNNLITLLHCVVSYPSKPEDANLRVIETLSKAFNLPVGLSDHTQDEFTSILAAQMGAVIIEKHFTLNHALNLPDHEAALDPIQFKLLVDRVKLVNKAMGNGVKNILPTEKKWREVARKSIYSAREIFKGEKIGENDLVILRPSSGLHPHLINFVIGQIADEDIPKGKLINFKMIRPED